MIKGDCLYEKLSQAGILHLQDMIFINTVGSVNASEFFPVED